MRLYQYQKKNDYKICYTRSKKAGVDEIIIVANGADIETIKQVNLENVIVIEFEEAIGHNVARAVGAMHATADICLFVDGGLIIPAKKLVPFCVLLKMEVIWH